MPPNPPRSASASAPSVTTGQGSHPAPKVNDNAPPVNRKKQKKRQSQAARRAAERHAPPMSPPGISPNMLAKGGEGYISRLPESQDGDRTTQGYDATDPDENYESREGEIFYSDEEGDAMPPPPPRPAAPKKKKKKNKNRPVPQADEQDPYDRQEMPGSFDPPPPPPPPPSNTQSKSADRKMSRDRIWNTSTAEERERIKEFWLSLEESQRRSLVKVEKEAVLKKMKEQQRNSCSCTVCGRKRTAIEEELEVLYDAYYEELEQYANHQQIDGTMIPPPVSYPNASQPRLQYDPRLMSSSRPKGRMMEEIEDDEEEEEVYSDEEDYGDDESYDDEPKGSAADFFNFGNSLTVKGGILTVADDLLKNDGKKFIEMMEQLAERRMAREKAHTSRFDPSPMRHPPLSGHDHPLDDEDEYDDDDDLDYDDSQDDEYDEDMEAMSEEQRMEEGRRMFQIFAARMFEQRVLTAYREKVAKERQEKLLEELADESRLDAQREAKRAKEAQKKKDRKKQQKAAKEEEKQRREAEKAAEEAAAKALEEKKLEEQRQKKEEQKKKKEAEKKAQEEERLRRELEKARRAQELKDQQTENERRQKEQREKEKKRKEEAKKKEREERETKEKEAREKKERDAIEKREREMKSRAEREAKERSKKEESTKQTLQPALAPVPPVPRKPSAIIPPIPPGLQASSSNNPSPHLPVATPVVPKAPTSGKPRQPSMQESQSLSPKPISTQSTSSTTSPSSTQPLHAPASASISANFPPASANQHQSQAPAPLIGPPPGMPQYPYGVHAGLPNAGFAATYGPSIPGTMSRVSPHEPPGFGQQQFVAPHRGYQSPAGLGFPPGINGMRGVPQGRGSPAEPPPGQGPLGGVSASSTWMPPHTGHSRHGSYEKHGFEPPSALAHGAIARPAPIQRPSSIPHPDEQQDVDELSSHLGSSALLDDADDGLSMRSSDGRSLAPGSHRTSQGGYGSAPTFPPPIRAAKENLNFSPRHVQNPTPSWGAPQPPMNSLAMPNSSSWAAAPTAGWGAPSQFGAIGGPGRAPSRPIALRLLACQAFRQLNAGSPANNSNGFHHIDHIVRLMDQLRPANDAPVSKEELLDILDTEGNTQNGGGNFSFQNVAQSTFVKHETDHGFGPRAAGEIGSPVGNSLPFGRGFAPATPSGF